MKKTTEDIIKEKFGNAIINDRLGIAIVAAMEEYAKQEALAYSNWVSNQVIAGRTTVKLWNDYQEIFIWI